MIWTALSALEESFLHIIQRGATEFSDAFWTVVTLFGESGIFWIALSLFLMIPKKTRLMGFTMGLALLSGLIFGNGLMKNLFQRPRPYQADSELACRLLWIEMSTDYSFPSGHTLASFEAAWAIFLFRKKWGAVALGAAVMIALSRLFLIVHYPSDIVFGALFGILFATLSAFFVRYLCRRFAPDFLEQYSGR